MTWLLLIMAALFCETFNQVQRGREQSPRYWYQEIDREIRITADSLLDNWAEMERRRYEEEEEEAGVFRGGEVRTIETGGMDKEEMRNEMERK